MAGLNLAQRIMFKQELELVKIDKHSKQLKVTLTPRKNIIARLFFIGWLIYLMITKHQSKLTENKDLL